MADFVDAILAEPIFERSNDVRWDWNFFSLLTRYFSTTLLYQFFFDRTFFHILFFYAYFLKHFGCIWLILLMRFWQIIFLKRQMTSDEAEIFVFITNQILLHNFALPVFFSKDFVHCSKFAFIFFFFSLFSSFFYHNFFSPL